jgi:hypothetical protein
MPFQPCAAIVLRTVPQRLHTLATLIDTVAYASHAVKIGGVLHLMGVLTKEYGRSRGTVACDAGAAVASTRMAYSGATRSWCAFRVGFLEPAVHMRAVRGDFMMSAASKLDRVRFGWTHSPYVTCASFLNRRSPPSPHSRPFCLVKESRLAAWSEPVRSGLLSQKRMRNHR